MLGQGTSIWVLVRMTAAIVLGSGALQPADTFNAGATVAASCCTPAVRALRAGDCAADSRLDRMPALAVGVAFGIAAWLVNYFVLAPSFFPWLIASRGAWSTPFLHAIFGVAAVGVYLALTARERRAGTDRRQVEQPVTPERRKPFERRGPA
jgi:hypothetical protein